MHELAELAYQAERLHLGVAGGWQDQYATVFGGFNFMEFRMDQNIVHPLRIHPDTLLELEESLLLCDTGTTHESGDIHEDQRREMQQDDVRILVRNNVELSYRMRNLLLRGRLLEFGHALDEAWQTKRRLSSKISNTRLDAVYDGAMRNGAVGGKLLGAGGGGFFLFYVPPFYKHQLMSYLEAREQRPMIVANVGGFTMDEPLPASAIQGYYERFAGSLQELDLEGVELIPQTMAPFPWHFGGQRYQNIFVKADEIVHWCRRLDMRMCFDVSHSRLTCNHLGVDFYDFAAKVAPVTVHLHLGDAKDLNGEGLQVGEGDIDFDRLGAILKAGSPRASFIPEIWQGHKNGGEGFWIALERLEGKL